LHNPGINSFGYGGANAHVVLEAAPAGIDAKEAKQFAVQQSSVVVPLSAATEASLEARLADLSQFNFGDADILDLVHTFGSRRSQLPTRGFLVAPRAEGIEKAFRTQTFLKATVVPDGGSLPIAFVFTGQGSQWPGMCRELFSEFLVFRNAIAEMDAVLQSIPNPPNWSLQQAILDTENTQLIHEPQRSQPCCTAIQVALLQLLASWDIRPSMAVGHSSGEIAAAFAAGHISAAESIVIAFYRGYCASKNTQDGAMMAAGLSESAANEEILREGLANQIRVACVNSPESVTISGDAPSIDQLLKVQQQKGVFARKVKTGGQAYHSHHMLAFGEEYESLLEKVLPTLAPSFQFTKGATIMSSVTGKLKSYGFGPNYWRSNLEGQVRFGPAIEEIHSLGAHYFVELGPHSSLELPIKQCLGNAEVKYAAPIKRNTNALETVLGLAGKLWLHGFAIDWCKVNGLKSPLVKSSTSSLFRVLTDLPPYRFDYGGILWSECRASIEYRQRKYPRHELLGLLVPGGNGEDLMFRNILQVGDVSWLQDHKLEETVVFPGAGYLGMAVEAVLQATGIDRSLSLSFRFENVNITNALTLSTEHGAQTEMFTTLRKSPITNAATSATWWDFNISTYQEGSSISHAKGSIAVSALPLDLESKYQAPSGLLEPSAKRTWYERMIKGGLNFGPTFQSITDFETPRMKTHSFTSAKAPLMRTCGDDLSSYPIHPITLDAMMQTAIVATTKGQPKELRAKVPTRFQSIAINTPATSLEQPCQIHAVAQSTGFGSADVAAEIIDANGVVVAQMDHLRLAPYHAAVKDDLDDKRHPVLRVLWKPDPYGLGYMANEAAQRHFDHFISEANSPVADNNVLKLGALLDVLAHKNPRLRILELGNETHEITLAALTLLAVESDFKRMDSYSTGAFAEDGSLSGGLVDLETSERCSEPRALDKGAFDLILMPTVGSWIEGRIDTVEELLAEDATILALCPGSAANIFTSSNSLSCVSYPVAEGQAELLVARKPASQSNAEALQKHRFLIVETEQTELGSALVDALQSVRPGDIPRVQLKDLTAEHIPSGTTVFSLCELRKPLLSTISDEDMDHVKVMTDRAASLVWLTNGNHMQGERPDHALVSGLARALVLEQPSLKFYTYDIDEPDADVQLTAGRLVSVLNQPGKKPDLEFVQRKGAAHVSRFVPDDGINTDFRAKQGLETTTMALNVSQDVRLAIENVGQFDTLFFKQQELPTSIAPTEIRIKVASVGLNAKDFYVLAGRVDTPNATCQLECAGTVERIGAEVTDFAVGDRVVAMAPTHFQTYQTLPQWACHRLENGESFDICATLPVVYATALYALHHRAKIQKGESVLIHSGAGGVGIAAIQIAKLAGAEVFTTVSTEEKKQYLIDTLGIAPSNIFSSRDNSFLPGILKATAGQGVDVIINSLTGDQLHSTWKCIANFGRFVEIGKLDMSTAGRLEMDQFLKNTTFTAFDLSYLYNTPDESHHALWKALLSEVMTLYRAGKITRFEPLQVFDITEATQAFRFFSSRSRMGKIAINMENGDAQVRVQQRKHVTRFHADKSYIMVGCLGGLGRTLSRWMLQRGAKKFVFLGRSGLDKPAARNLVQDLESLGAECVVVRGDVCNAMDVEAVVDAAKGDIGGVVQAAMGLNVSLSILTVLICQIECL
jgi:acyl transferase domain-containing protein/NADPH:quinone reductase-like Zn-dependent oxidoreductase